MESKNFDCNLSNKRFYLNIIYDDIDGIEEACSREIDIDLIETDELVLDFASKSLESGKEIMLETAKEIDRAIKFASSEIGNTSTCS